MLFWAENAFWGIGGHKGDGYWNASAYPVNESDRAEFENSVKAQLKELIHIHRNHPSIIVWSMSNEPFFTAAGRVGSSCLESLTVSSSSLRIGSIVSGAVKKGSLLMLHTMMEGWLRWM